MKNEKIFVSPQKPFLLIFESPEGEISVAWLNTEKDLMECVKEVKEYGNHILNAFEIERFREICAEEQ